MLFSPNVVNGRCMNGELKGNVFDYVNLVIVHFLYYYNGTRAFTWDTFIFTHV